MGRSLEGQTQATNTTVTAAESSSPARASMEEPTTPEVDQKGGPEPDSETSTGTSTSPASNGDAPLRPRLAALTGRMIGQQRNHQTPSSSEADPKPPPPPPPPAPPSMPDSGDQASTPYFGRSVARFDDDDTGSGGGTPRRTASFGSTVASTLNAHRRAAALTAGGGGGPSGGGLTETDLRRFVFQHPRTKRLVSGLRVHAFTRQAFVSSFTVGLAIGSVVAIILKIMKDLTSRMLFS